MTDAPVSSAPEVARLTTIESQGFFPADYAAVENGKVYASGAYWAMLKFVAFPAVLPSMALIAVIRVPFHANQADHTLQMGLVGADGKALGMRVEGAFRAAPKIEHRYGEPGTSCFAPPIHGLTFSGPGEYSFTLAVDGREIDRYPFSVVQIATVAMMQGLAPALPQE